MTLALNVLAVAIGGAIGASMRYLVAVLAHGAFGFNFPYGTFVVNVLGSLAIGYMLVLIPEHPEANPFIRLMLFTGILGGFTTYSAFSVETMQLVHDGQVQKALLNIFATLFSCFAAVWAGFHLARLLHGPA